MAPNEPLQVLRNDGRPRRGRDPRLQPDELRALYEAALRIRACDERLLELSAEGWLSAYRSAAGEEALIAGIAFALEAGDMLLPPTRSPAGTCIDHACGRPLRVFAPASPSAARLSHAVGLACAATLRRDPVVAAVLFGEGSMSQGELHAALNFAAVRKAPCLFVYTCSRADGPTVDDEAEAYGVTGRSVDAGDALAVVATIREARKRALHGEGPTLVRAVMGLRDDPLALLAAFVRAATGASDTDLAESSSRAKAAAEEAARAAVAAPAPDASRIIEDVFAAVPWHLEEERGALPGTHRSEA